MQHLGRIYALIEPQTGEIRYVGQTKDQMKHRLYRHHFEGRTSNGTSHRTTWLRKQMRIGYPPIAVIVQEVALDCLDDAEIFWISHFKERGCALVNHHPGGNGGWEVMRGKSSPRKGTKQPEWRKKQISEKLSGKKLSAETRAKMSAARQRDRELIAAKTQLAWDEGRAGNGWTTGKYTADPVSCIICRRVCKGRSALSRHITKTKNHVGAL